MATPETRPRRLVASLIGLVVIVLIVIGFALYLRGRAAGDELDAQIALLQRADDSSETLYEWAGDDARTQVSALRGLALPADAASARVARQGRLRPIYWLRFQLLQDELDAFLISICVARLEEGYRPAFVYGVQPEVSPTCSGGSQTRPSASRAGTVPTIPACITGCWRIWTPGRRPRSIWKSRPNSAEAVQCAVYWEHE